MGQYLEVSNEAKSAVNKMLVGTTYPKFKMSGFSCQQNFMKSYKDNGLLSEMCGAICS